MKRIYLAGPISLNGKLDATTVAENLLRFHEAAKALRARGYHVENPAENEDTTPPRDWSSWMRVGLAQLLTCDEVWMLPNWKSSRGAIVERGLAESLHIPIFEYAEVPS